MSSPLKFACLALLVIAAGPAQAASLPAPAILGTTQITHTGETVSAVGFGTINVSNAAYGSAELTLSGTPSPFIQATAVGAPNPINNSVVRAVGQFDYSLSIVGPPGAVPVLVTVSGIVQATAGAGSVYALESSWSLVGQGVNAGDAIRTGAQPGSISDGFGHTLSVLLTTGQVYTITMRADAQISVTDASTGQAFASIDPTFAFGPGVDPTLYSFDFSPGIGNSVPEPGSSALLGGALAGAVIRRRQRARR